MCKNDQDQVITAAQNPQVLELLQTHLAGGISRRDFIVRAGMILSGVAVGASLNPVGALRVKAQDSTATPSPTPPSPVGVTDLGDPTVKLITRAVAFPAGELTVPGYLAHPEGEGPFPGVVVIQEWWGVDDHIKSVVELMARHGFAALAPDLYHGEVAEEPNEARKLAMALIMSQAIQDVQGAADYLTNMDIVQPKKVGVMGFCMGGRIAMQMSWDGQENIGAVASFYGGGLNPTDAQFEAVKVPVLSLYGDQDGGIPIASIREWEAKFKTFNKINETVIYEGAPHAFFNDTRSSYRPEAAKDALARLLVWFERYLKEA